MEVKKTKDQKKVQIIKDLKKRKGITLIALVITITILMILAGITVSKITGKEGFLIKTKSVSEETNR